MLIGLAAMGMSEGTERGSVTALAVLAGVCVAGTERDATVRVDDPVAPQLIRWGDGRFAAGRVRALHPLMRRMVERTNPGSYGYAIARMHHMDAIVRREVAAGLDRLVILGAGYDTRAYRMSTGLSGVSVFEVDHPATSREKRARLEKALGSLPANVTYVEVDFTHQNLLERLADHGHELSARTLFLLSGVAMFLPDTAVFELFNQIAAHTSPRTSLLFDYVFKDVLTVPDRYYGGREWVPYVTGLDEEPRSGIPAGDTEAVLADHGLRLDSHLDAEELEARYLHRADGTSVASPFGFCAIAHAFVTA
jgi:methyltransferase (TIGR00027 family)